MRRHGILALLSIRPLLIGALSWADPSSGEDGPWPLGPGRRAEGHGATASRRHTNAGRYVVLQLRTAKDRYRRREPIVVECRLVNWSQTLDAHYFCMYGRYSNPRESDFVFHVGVIREGVARRDDPVRVAPRELLRQPSAVPARDRDTRRVTINTIFDIRSFGEYRLAATIAMQGPEDDGQGWHAWLVRSEEVEVVIDRECPC